MPARVRIITRAPRPRREFPRPATWPAALALLALPVALLAACGGGSGGGAQPTVTVTKPGSSSGSPAGSQAASPRPPIVAVTTAGALVRLDPNSGNVAATLVANGVAGGELAVTPDGSAVYFASGTGCSPEIEKIPVAGGTPVPVTAGSLPAISPDGSKLAFVREPLVVNSSCFPDMTSKLIVRDISSPAEVTYPLPPGAISNGLPMPISYVSWAPDNKRLALSMYAVQDNEGWAVNILDTTSAQYYLPGAGVTNVPPTGSPTPAISYLRQGIFLPDGNLFVSRACCGGVPVRDTSQLLWVVDTSGQLVHQVAVGYPDKQHLSLSADPGGHWLLYLSGADLYVSAAGATPSKLATGLLAAAWS